MRIIVSDTSCLIDLRKAALLAAFLRLPFGEILIPNSLFEDELLSFSVEEKENSGKGRAQGCRLTDRRFPGPAMSFVRSLASASTMDLRLRWLRFILAASCSPETPGCGRWRNPARSKYTAPSGFATDSSRASSQRPSDYIPPFRSLRRTPQFGCRSVNWLRISGAIKPTNDREA